MFWCISQWKDNHHKLYSRNDITYFGTNYNRKNVEKEWCNIICKLSDKCWGKDKKLKKLKQLWSLIWWGEIPYSNLMSIYFDHLHLNDFKKLITKGIKADSFASHFTNHCKTETKPTNDELCRMMKVKIIWQGNAISCMKSFGKLNYSLCMHERFEILCTIRQEEWKIINNCTEIHGACRHKTRFHRFIKEHTNVK
jgi:hypothetical protein